MPRGEDNQDLIISVSLVVRSVRADSPIFISLTANLLGCASIESGSRQSDLRFRTVRS